ncbi:DNA/RNA helicase, superfamily II [Frateuria aurantia DSM 6220]|uniref:DNA/RNA helicase, superfamily II n=1 Tax=Frateuria aurantia (strain ATCC 33424 / DSM 6220 / KCTC 2777 / LMG 1558 / NBRC 3245 / NCIMB 13370) TaxID=767434 RepID=H8L3M2_FRAAD|nr:DNA/RNA helicase, superfamily II [Frateuria aurantia DSM 6220]
MNLPSSNVSPAAQPLPPVALVVNNAASPAGPRFEVVESSKARQPGVYFQDDSSDRPAVWICAPLYIEAETRNADGGEWGRLLSFKDRDGKEHRWAMPCAMLATDGAELRAELLGQGLVIANAPSARKLLMDYIQQANPAQRARSVSRTGWHGDVFALPDRTIGPTAAEAVIFQTYAPGTAQLSTGGTMQSWRDEVAARCAGHSRLVLALSVAFSGICQELAGMDGGGVHLRGSSSTGKTTAVLVASSVYGPPAYMRTWRQTDNALEGVATLHNDLLLPLDELGQLEPKDAGKVAYMLANGQGKGRSDRSGRARAVATWRTAFLSSGEVSLGDLVAESGGRRRAGHDVRVIDVAADAGKGHGMFEALPVGVSASGLAEQLKQSAAAHYGFPLLAFLEQVTADRRAARQRIDISMAALLAEAVPEDAGGQVRRVARRFALIAAAGELATHYGITGWAQGEAHRAAVTCFRQWLADRGGPADAERAALLSQVRAFFEAHGDSRFEPEDHDNERWPVPNRAGFRRKVAASQPGSEEIRQQYLVMPEAFKELVRGFNPKAAAQMLIAAGWLLPGIDGKASQSIRVRGMGRSRLYVIDETLVFSADD